MKSQLLIAAALTASLAACTTTTPRSAYVPPSSSAYYPPPAQSQRCYNCGQIVRIESVAGARQNSRAGAVLGGIVGAVAGHEIADDDDQSEQNVATAVGAVGGAVAGNAIENRMIAQTYDIHVRMDDGRVLIFNRNSLSSGVREGAYVQVTGTNFDVLD